MIFSHVELVQAYSIVAVVQEHHQLLQLHPMMTEEHYDSYPWGVGEHYLAQHSLDNIEVEVALAYRMELWDQPVVVGGHDTSLEHLGLSSSSPAGDAFDIGGLLWL